MDPEGWIPTLMILAGLPYGVLVLRRAIREQRALDHPAPAPEPPAAPECAHVTEPVEVRYPAAYGEDERVEVVSQVCVTCREVLPADWRAPAPERRPWETVRTTEQALGAALSDIDADECPDCEVSVVTAWDGRTVRKYVSQACVAHRREALRKALASTILDMERLTDGWKEQGGVFALTAKECADFEAKVALADELKRRIAVLG